MFKPTQSQALVVQVEPFTQDSLQAALPVNIPISKEMVDKINNILTNEDIAESFRENLIGFASVLSTPNASISGYINAVKFNSFVIMDYSYRKAWEYTFPDKYKDLVAKGATSKEIASHVASYRRGQMVTKVAEQALVPSYIYNQVFFQEAINTQVSIMRDEDVLPRDRIAAAESVLKYTQVPDSMVGNKSELQEKGLSIIDKLATSMDKLVSMQQEMIESKQLTVLNVAKSKIYEGEYYEHGE